MVSKIFNFLVQIITLGSISSVLGTNDTLGSRCRCLYADPSCWPSDADFASLASQLSQSLIYPVPPESACYPPSNPSGNCTQVLLNTFNGTWRSDQPGSMQAPNFETFIFTNDSISACYLNTTLGVPCEQGNVPPIGVDARTPGDIQTAVVFAKKWNLQVVIKSTGHDFLGRSSGHGSFMIWTHNMKNITYNPTFVPAGGLSNETYNALTLGAGVQWQEAYEAAELHGRFLIGGIAPGGSVGAAGGWILGGGHSVLSPQYGLGVDNVLEFTIVTSSGLHLTVNAYSDPDLFWALRGGGGGTYGVLTSVTYNTHPTEPVVLVVLEALNITSPNTTQSIVSEFVHFSPNLTDLGWGGYSYITPQTFQFFGVSPNTSWADTNATIKPLFDFVGSATGGNVVATTIPFDSFYTLYTTVFSPSSGEGNSIGQNVEIISRLLPRDLVETNYEKVAETLVGANNLVAYHLVAGGAVSKVDPDSTGLNPAWRSAASHVVVGASWPEGTNVTDIRQIEDELKGGLGVFEELVGPNGGAYFNEASLYEQNFQETFFGDHYPKLLAIKDEYDPVGLFVVVEGVGSERWDRRLDCLSS